MKSWFRTFVVACVLFLSAETAAYAQAPRDVPVGSIVAYWGLSAPPGWLLCDGSDIPQRLTELRQLVGPKTPNLQGNFLHGVDPTGTVDPDGGRQANNALKRPPGSVQADLVKEHSHGYQIANKGGKSGADPLDLWTQPTTANTSASRPGLGAETRPRNVAVNYIIKH
jgi:hypothetical protein